MKISVKHSSIAKRRPGQDSHNEDFLVADKRNQVFIVADGVGSAVYGGLASQVVSQTLHEDLKNIRADYVDGRFSEDEFLEIIDFAVRRTNFMVIQSRLAHTNANTVNGVIRQLSKVGGCEQMVEELTSVAQSLSVDQSSEFHKFSSTLDALVLANDKAYFAHVGNGRIYHYGERLEKLTSEHVASVPEVLEPMYSVLESRQPLSSYMGATDIRIDIGQVELRPNQSMFIATDGVTHTVSHLQVWNMLRDFDTAKAQLYKALNNPVFMAAHYALSSGKNFLDVKKQLRFKDDASYVLVRRDE